MKSPVVLVGVGEMGGVFARGLLRLGHPVFPVVRGASLSAAAEQLPEPQLALIAVGEADLATTLAAIPATWRGRLGLLQNELLPRDWDGCPDPTVISVWFEKKPGRDHQVIIPSPTYGPQADLLIAALTTLAIPARRLPDETALLFELVLKNLYILTTNIAGLRTGGTVGQLWSTHRALAEQVGHEVIDLQEALTEARFDRDALFAGLAVAFAGDPEHACMGRSAPARLARAIQHGDALGLALPLLRRIAAEQGGNAP
ncbi:hypothetical protein CKO25_06565 [Thiocapsa imhoffii]|uniref:Uncharacterized protein n=1 Tax=Thiocapsa imhoffii TaxID=382777 RepID=A0A9X0WGN0_9GAMM|nr:hypothetical protein [Thiocapsa imhoffii]MBK1644322.1 hypothetical protein [Thiocapsa imhoffii]